MSQSKDRASRAILLKTHDTDYEADISSDENLSRLPSTPVNVGESRAPQIDVRRRALKSVHFARSTMEDSNVSPGVPNNGKESLEDVSESTNGNLGGTPVTVCFSHGSSTLASPQTSHVTVGIPSRSPSVGSSSSPYPSSSSPCVRLPDHTNILSSITQPACTPAAVVQRPEISIQRLHRSERPCYHGSPTIGLSALSISSSPPLSLPATYVLRRSLPGRLNELHLHSEDFHEAGPSRDPRAETPNTQSKSTAQSFRVAKAVGEVDEVLSLTPDLNIRIKTKDGIPSGSSAINSAWLPVLPSKRAAQAVEHEYDELVMRLKDVMKERKEDGKFNERVVATLRGLVSEV